VEFLAVVVDDQRGNLVALAYDYQVLGGWRDIQFTVEDHQVFRQYFNSERDLEDDIDGTLATHIVGRSLAKVALALALHSPLQIKFLGRTILGLLKLMFLGSTTTGKSEIGKAPMQMGIYDMVTGDLSKTTGLMAAVDVEEKTVIWGAIPLADKEAIFVDSFQKIEPEDLARMREALRTGRVDVTKMVRARAPCRTRIIAAANSRQDLDNYLNPCEGILDCWPFRESPDIARWDLFIPFLTSDVPAEEIAKARAKEPKIPPEIFRKHVFWAWGLGEDDIIFTEEAEKTIIEGFLKFSKWALPKLPLVNYDTRNVLAKIAAAYAILRHRVVYQTLPVQQMDKVGVDQKPENPDPTLPIGSGGLVNSGKLKVLVDKEAAEWAVNFYQRMLDAWDYPGYTGWILNQRTLSEEEVEEIDRELSDDPTARKIFMEIAKKRGIEVGALAEKLGYTKQWIVKEVAKLKALDLVESKERRRGYWLTIKGVSYAKMMLEKEKPPESLEREVSKEGGEEAASGKTVKRLNGEKLIQSLPEDERVVARIVRHHGSLGIGRLCILTGKNEEELFPVLEKLESRGLIVWDHAYKVVNWRGER
ncbi:hypothetical protein J7L60_05110, partial [Candidatus Bathyarchaeota archaeon]|nr:hypothetical protein [Candidatus Bathyarchaeota archaeon]